MNKITKQIISIILLCSFFMSLNAFAESVSITYSGVAKQGELVGLMVVDADADPENLKREDIYSTDIIEADDNGEISKTVLINDAILDEAGKVTNYKVLSGIELTENITVNKEEKLKYNFADFTVSPVFFDGVLYVPIEETLELIGGETVSYIYDEQTKAYTGKANNGEFSIIMGKDTVEVDWVDVELPGTLKTINGTNMMPAYAIKYILKTGDISSDSTSFTLSEGIKEKFPEREVDIAKIVDELPAPQSTIVMGHWSKDTSQDYVTLSTAGVEIDGKAYTAQQIETKHDRFGTIPELAGIQVIHWQYSGELKKQEIGLLSFKARATRITDESGVAMIGVEYQAPNYYTAVSEVLSISDQWQQFYLPAYNAFYDYPGSYKSRLVFRVGGKPMTIQIADLSIVSYGVNEELKKKLTETPEAGGYKGIEEDHVWRQEAWNRIEKYRKEDITAEVVDATGNPVEGAEVQVKMTENEFMFGAAMCQNEILNLDMSTIKGRVFDSFMENDINTGVCADMMKSTEVVDGNGILGIEMVNEYLRRGLRVRGHCMYWDGVGMSYLDAEGKENYDEMYRQTIDYVRSMAHLYKGKLEQWDVINEPVNNNSMRLDYKTTRLYSDIFKEIHRIDPDVKLYINETGIEGRRDKNMPDRIPGLISGIVEPLKKEGAPVHGIGIQAHCSNYYYPQGFYHQLDDCAQAVDEVAITEYDLYNEKTEYAPNHLEDMVLATVSHPKATAFIVWNPEDSMHWRWANAAPFFRRDFSSKPAHLKWQELVGKVYSTNETVKTDANGKAKVRAFRGDYEVRCSYNGVSKTVALGNTTDGGSSVKFVIDGSSISATASAQPRVKPEAIELATLSEANRDYDAQNKTDFTNILVDVNFKGAEYSDLVIKGGDLGASEGYQSGDEWGSTNGMGSLLSGTDSVDTVVTTNGSYQCGYLFRKARADIKYEDSTIYHETLFSTLSPVANNSFNVFCGISTDTETQRLATVSYDGGKYFIKLPDDKEIALERNTDYMLKTCITPSGNSYNIGYEVIKNGAETVETHICNDISLENLVQINEVSYCIEAWVTPGEDVLKLHNTRLYEYRVGDIIELDRADLEAYLLEDDMNFNPAEAEYLGTKLAVAPKDWSLIGANNNSSDFEFVKYRAHIAPMQKNQTTGAHSLAKGFDKIKDGESMEISFDLWLNATAPRMDSVGTASIDIGSADKSTKLSLVKYRFTPWYDDNSGNYPFVLSLLQSGDGYKYSQLINGDGDDSWKRSFISVSAKLNYNEGGYYSGVVEATNSKGETISATTELLMSREQAAKLDTIFINYHQETAGSNHKNQEIFGIKNLKIRKFGKTMYEDNAASLAKDEATAVGIKYNNVTGSAVEAMLIVAGYNDERLVYNEARSVWFDKGKGFISADIPGNVDVETYKLYLWDKDKGLKPYKSADVITIQN